MSDTSSVPLLCWNTADPRRLERDLITATHRLAELPIFSDEGLAAMLDRFPIESMRVTTMGENPAHPTEHRIGQPGQYDGRTWIEMLRRGRLCVRLSNLADIEPELGQLVDQLAREWTSSQPDLNFDQHVGELVLSSPYVIEYLAFDSSPTLFWQIRGRTRFYAYPPGAPFLPQSILQEQIAAESREHLYFDPEFDKSSRRFEQSPGTLLGLPQHTPYRTVCGGTLCIALMTTYCTRGSKKRNEVQCANRLLDRCFPLEQRSASTEGPAAASKQLMLKCVNGLTDELGGTAPEPSFSVNPLWPKCIGPITSEPVEDGAAESAPSIASLGSTPMLVAHATEGSQECSL